jgi:hypothetical protein
VQAEDGSLIYRGGTRCREAQLLQLHTGPSGAGRVDHHASLARRPVDVQEPLGAVLHGDSHIVPTVEIGPCAALYLCPPLSVFIALPAQ